MIGSRAACRVAALAAITFFGATASATPAEASDGQARSAPTELRVVAATKQTISVAWQKPRVGRGYRYRVYLGGHASNRTRRPSATFKGLECGRAYTVEVDARARRNKRHRSSSLTASTTPCRTVDLSELCADHNCDDAFAGLQPQTHYYLPAGVWEFTRPLHIPSNVTLTGDGTGVTGTDLVYSGPPTTGAAVIAGSNGGDWVNGHIAGVEIETAQLHALRLKGDTAYAAVPITQAAIGLQVLNPSSSSTVSNVNAWKFGQASVQIENRAAAPGPGFFEFSNFFVGTSPHPFEVHGSRAQLLVRFGGIDLGPLSEVGMLFDGDRRGSTDVVESVKIEGDYDVPGYVVDGLAPVVFVGTTRYLNQSLYVDNPLNGAPAFSSLGRGPRARTALQCLACTALGERTAFAMPGLSSGIATSKWGINLHRLTPAGARNVRSALETAPTPLARPHDVINLGPRCIEHNCDAALAELKFGGRYYLPAGMWTFSRPFTIPETATFFGDGRQPASRGGTTLRYVGPSIPGDAAVRFGAGGGDMSGRLFSLRIDTIASLTGGLGVRARDASNASTIEDIAISGFPDGQLRLDATPAGGGSGPNFVRVTRFSLRGGVHPLQVVGGRQTLLIEEGKIELDDSSEEGVTFTDGEQLAATRIVQGVSVEGGRDVPGFRVRSPAPTAFIRSSRTFEGHGNTAPGFLYTALVPRRVTECLDCAVTGSRAAFSMPQLGADVPGPRPDFSVLNSDSSDALTRGPFNLVPPAITGEPRVGSALGSTAGTWTNVPTRYAYQWIRCKRPDVPSNPATRCERIGGATGPAYAVTPADAGFYLRLSVSASNPFGSDSATSLATPASG